MLDFFAGLTAEQLLGYALALLAGLGVPTAPFLFQKIKKYFGWEDEDARTLVRVGSFILAGLALYVSGEVDFAGLELNLSNLIALYLFIDEYARLIYRKYIQG